MKGKWRKRILVGLSALMAGLLMSVGIPQLVSDINANMVFATGENVVTFSTDVAEANDSNLVFVDLTCQGTAGDKVTVTYRTSSVTAIENVDYVGVYNTITLELDKKTGTATQPISIKCLNDANTREKYRLYNDKGVYGRYFELKIVSVSNANIGAHSFVQCYLPYDHKVHATTGINDSDRGREVAYITDLKTMVTKYHKGDNDIKDHEHWRTWKEGISFNDSTSSATMQHWINTYINPGFADAYGSYVIKEIDDDKISNSSNIHLLSGNKEFIDKYDRKKDCPGLSLYYQMETDEGDCIDGKAMYYIANKIDPSDKDDDLINVVNWDYVSPDWKQIYWFQEGDAWYSKSGSVYDSVFWKTPVYNGTLDYGLSIYNGSGSWDREVHHIWMFLTLFDTKKPTIVGQYSEFNAESGTIRIYLRFSEPVYSCKKGPLSVNLNDKSKNYFADYVCGNYSDTLVYEIAADETPNFKITSMRYELPTEDVGDMAYIVDAYKKTNNNLVQNTDKKRDLTLIEGNIDLSRPQLAVDNAKSEKAHNIYNLMLSANGNGEGSFNQGTIYYTWSKEEYLPNPSSTTSYANSHVLTSEERGSFGVTLAKNEAAGIDSGDYYLHALAVSKYGFTANNTFGPYKLDGDAPEITLLDMEKDELKDKIYPIQVKDKAMGTGIDRLTMSVNYKDDAGKAYSVKQNILVDGDKNPDIAGLISLDHDAEAGATNIKYRSCLDEEAGVPTDDFILNLMGEKPRLLAEVSFEMVDFAGNKGKTSSISTFYDKRSLFENDVNVPAQYQEIIDANIDIPAKVYDISQATAEDGLTFEISDPDIKALIDAGAEYSVIVNGDAIFESEGGYSVQLKGLAPGYYQAVGHISGVADETTVDMVSKTFPFYLTNAMKDATINKTNSEGNLVLTTRTFQLEDVAYYYFNSVSSSVNSHLYGAVYNPWGDKYDGGSSTPTFSSDIEAKKYIKYMEYQDLEVISITTAIANILNSGSGSTVYVKAANETTNARDGQLWIRYKRSTWTSTSGVNGWAFYYYGEGKAEDGINVNGLSPNLSSAIDAVTNRIVGSGKTRYLVGDDYTHSRTGAPYLADSQMHVSSESVSQTKMGNVYVTNPIYAGDSELFRNNVTIADTSYPLATNLALEVGEGTALYFKEENSTVWQPIKAEDGTLLKTALAEQTTGLYTIREYGDAGVGEFTVYIDKSLPLLDVTLNKDVPGEKETELTLDGEITRISGKKLCLGELINEADDEAYVAVYSYPGRSLITVLYGEDIKDYTLEEGNFYVTVGDRSGNIVTYQVMMGDTPLEVSITENEAKTAVIVRVDNRDESEIYSYEVFLNETLLDNEYAESKTYRGAGVYRVEVTDIYGNRVIKNFTHENPSPELTWYYVNDNGGYSVYDPDNPVRMTMEDDPSSSRTTNVYASTMVRILFNSAYSNDEIEFELLDINPGDYSYNSSSGLLSINTLSSWRLRVWYKNHPESDHIYVFHLDAEAPEVNATFVGTAHSSYVEIDEDGNVIVTSNFETLDPNKYNEGDTATLDTLAYEKSGSTTMSFYSGAVISGKNIILSFTDPSGIRSVTVTRNGQPLEMELSVDGTLIINSYGTYVVTVTDNLGNTRTFLFTNLEEDISTATVDGEIAEQDILIYGNDNLEISTGYDGTNTILVQVGEESYAYEFRYEGGVLTYGQYIVHIEEYMDEGDQLRKRAWGEYSQNPNFLLEADDPLLKRGTYYPAIQTESYVIYAMIDEDGHAHYKIEVVENEITVETLYRIGSEHLPNRYCATLSRKIPEILLLTGGQPVDTKTALEYIFVIDDLTIDKNSVTSDITSISVAYSGMPKFDEPTLIYKDGEWLADFKGEEYGFYQIIVTNKYHNQITYLVSKIESFAAVVNLTYLDGTVTTFYNNESPFFSNYSIELIVSSTEVQFEVNGVLTSGFVEGGSTTLTLNRDGEYEVRVVGVNGVFQDYSFKIYSDDKFFYDESWITGYNEEALLRDQGYTNTFCSVVLDKGVAYVGLTVNDERSFVLYDNISQEKKLDPLMLQDVIGRYGVGKYVLSFRNQYGDVATKTVYYNNIPTIVLTRAINSDPLTYQEYDLGLAIEKGFYSNYVLSFATTSESYVFTINGVEVRLDQPKKLDFTNPNGTGSFEYTITYLDAYGNYVEFKAILSREDVKYDASAMKIITVNNISYTKDDICLTFAEGLKATLSVDGGEAKDYQSGEMHYADGEYRFVVRDIAGNQSTYVVVHKSVNHFSLTNSTSGEEVPDGGVVNNGTVNFYSNEGSKIKYVVRNGELMADYNSTTFTVTGHYEILIEDAIGNQSYKEFTIINNELATFDYAAPFEFEVSEVWRINADGSREMLNVRGPKIHLEVNGDYVVVVTSTKTTSSFNFTVTINNAPPTAELVGATNGEVTARDVTLTGLRNGDVVKIYKDGELFSTTTIGVSTETPTINTGGQYRVTVTNVQGVTIEFTFTRKAVTNVAGSIFFIVTSFLAVVGLGIGLIYHTRLKTDD